MPQKQYLFDYIIERPRLSMVTGILLIFVGLLVSALPKMVISLGWQPTSGVVTYHQIQKKRFPEYDGDIYEEIQVYLRYEYTVNGTLYTSGSVSAINAPFYPPEIVEQYPVDTAVTVYYNPKDPSEAVLEPGFVDVLKAFNVFSYLLFGAGIYFIIIARKTKMRESEDLRLG